jgi:hypothetical protein
MKILGEVVEPAAALVGGRGRHGGGTAGAAGWAATGMGDDDRRRPRHPTMTSRSNPHFAEALGCAENRSSAVGQGVASGGSGALQRMGASVTLLPQPTRAPRATIVMPTLPDAGRLGRGPYAGPRRAQVRMAVRGEEDAAPVSARCSRSAAVLGSSSWPRSLRGRPASCAWPMAARSGRPSRPPGGRLPA